jgi:hypothetical protein
MDVLAVDISLALILLGLASLVRPLRFLGIRTRMTGAVVGAAGLAALVLGLMLPVTPPRLPGAGMALDEVLPVYQFGEHHEIRVAAPPERVLAAARAVTAGEIRLFRLLTWLRSPRLPGRGRESILNPSAERPILDVALRSGFVLLREEKDREIVFGAVVCCGPRMPPRSAQEFHALQGSLARAVMSFYVEDAGGGVSRLVTQTRIHATDAAAQRRFAAYWRVIYPGSALLRVTWLRAIRSRAEAAAPLPASGG